jgi:hypothetical protein
MFELGGIRRSGLPALGALAKNPFAHIGGALDEFNALIFAGNQELNYPEVH